MSEAKWDEQELANVSALHHEQRQSVQMADIAADILKQAKELYDQGWIIYAFSEATHVQVFFEGCSYRSFTAKTWINEMLIPCYYYPIDDGEDPVGYLDEDARAAMHEAGKSLQVSVLHSESIRPVNDPEATFSIDWLWRGQRFFCLASRAELLKLWDLHGERFPTVIIDEDEFITLLKPNPDR